MGEVENEFDHFHVLTCLPALDRLAISIHHIEWMFLLLMIFVADSELYDAHDFQFLSCVACKCISGRLKLWDHTPVINGWEHICFSSGVNLKDQVKVLVHNSDNGIGSIQMLCLKTVHSVYHKFACSGFCLLLADLIYHFAFAHFGKVVQFVAL